MAERLVPESNRFQNTQDIAALLATFHGKDEVSERELKAHIEQKTTRYRALYAGMGVVPQVEKGQQVDTMGKLLAMLPEDERSIAAYFAFYQSLKNPRVSSNRGVDCIQHIVVEPDLLQAVIGKKGTYTKEVHRRGSRRWIPHETQIEAVEGNRLTLTDSAEGRPIIQSSVLPERIVHRVQVRLGIGEVILNETMVVKARGIRNPLQVDLSEYSLIADSYDPVKAANMFASIHRVHDVLIPEK